MATDCKYCPFHKEVAEIFDDDCFEQLSANYAVVNFVKGNSIIKQGALSTNVFFLRKGLVKIHLAGSSREQIVRLVKAPTYFGFCRLLWATRLINTQSVQYPIAILNKRMLQLVSANV